MRPDPGRPGHGMSLREAGAEPFRLTTFIGEIWEAESAAHYFQTEEEARAYLKTLYDHVPVFDTGARGATATFAVKGIGDVHLTYENEAKLEVERSAGELEIVYPHASLRI